MLLPGMIGAGLRRRLSTLACGRLAFHSGASRLRRGALRHVVLGSAWPERADGLEREVALAPAEAGGAVESLLDCDLLFGADPVGLFLADLQLLVVKADREVVGDRALDGLGEEALEVDALGQWAVRIGGIGRRFGEALVPERNVDLFEEAVGGFEGRDLGDAQFLDQAVLRGAEARSMRPLAWGD
jgi:hypothetical protein